MKELQSIDRYWGLEREEGSGYDRPELMRFIPSFLQLKQKVYVICVPTEPPPPLPTHKKEDKKKYLDPHWEGRGMGGRRGKRTGCGLEKREEKGRGGVEKKEKKYFSKKENKLK